MAKRAIYLDYRERDLARRIFKITIGALEVEMQTRMPLPLFAYRWTKDEIERLLAKFEEPASVDHD